MYCVSDTYSPNWENPIKNAYLFLQSSYMIYAETLFSSPANFYRPTRSIKTSNAPNASLLRFYYYGLSVFKFTPYGGFAQS